MQNARQVPSRETARRNGCFLSGVKRRAPLVKYARAQGLLVMEFITRGFLGGF